MWKRACKGLCSNNVGAADSVVAVLVYVKNQKKQKEVPKFIAVDWHGSFHTGLVR